MIVRGFKSVIWVATVGGAGELAVELERPQAAGAALGVEQAERGAGGGLGGRRRVAVAAA